MERGRGVDWVPGRSSDDSGFLTERREERQRGGPFERYHKQKKEIQTLPPRLFFLLSVSAWFMCLHNHTRRQSTARRNARSGWARLHVVVVLT